MGSTQGERIPGGHMRLPNWFVLRAIPEFGLTGSDVRVYLAMLASADGFRVTHLSRTRLVEITALSATAVKQSVARLAETGLIVVESAAKGRAPARWWLPSLMPSQLGMPTVAAKHDDMGWLADP